MTVISFPTSAQITSDRTLPTPSQLTSDGTRNLIIEGTSQGRNLFHSFLEFNIDNGQQVYFANPSGIDTILSRVTGGDRSNILGTLGVDGPADLFLLNPNGIVFGPNARLDVTGSFYASTASQLTFDDGSVFSATQPENSLLTISTPLGLQYGMRSGGAGEAGEAGGAGEAIASAIYSDTNGDISNEGELGVASGQSLMLVGDRVSHRGSLVAPNGRISLIGNQLHVVTPGTLDVSGNIDTTGTVWLEATEEITILNGVGKLSTEGLAETVLESLSGDTDVVIQAGDRILFQNLADDALRFQAGTGTIQFIADSDGDGESDGNDPIVMEDTNDSVQALGRDVTIAAAQLNLGYINTSTPMSLAGANSGSITLTSTNGNIQVTSLMAEGSHHGGDINVVASGGSNSGSFVVRESLTTVGSQGNSGDVRVAATGDIRFRPQASLLMQGQLAGDLQLESDRDIIFQGGVLSQESTTIAEMPGGRGGGFEIRGRSLHLRDGAQLVSVTLGSAPLKRSRVTVEQSLTIRGFNTTVPANPFGLLATQVATGATGHGGNLRVEAGTVEIRDAAVLATRTFGLGNAGNLTVIGDEVIVAGAVDVSDSPLLAEGSETLFESELSTEAERESEEVLFLEGEESDDPFALNEANAGDMLIRVGRLRVEDGGEVSAGTHSRGDGGNFTLIADEIIITGEMLGEASELGTETVPEFLGSRPPEGNAGNLVIRSDRLIVTNGGAIGVATMALGGNAGTIDIDVRELEVGGGFIFDGKVKNSTITSEVLDPQAEGSVGDTTRAFGGNGGEIRINADTATFWGGGQVVASTAGNGPSGDVTIAARLINIDGALGLPRMPEFDPVPSGVFASSDVDGQAAGNIFIMIGDRLSLSNTAAIAATTFGDEGNITINGGSLLMTNGSQLTTNAAGSSTGGNITINLDNLIATPELGNSDITANAEDGSGGQIQIQTRSPILGFQIREGDTFRATNQTPMDTLTNDITAFSQFNPTIDVGTVTIEPPEVDPPSAILNSPTPVERSDRIVAGCPAQQGNTFTIVSQGGLPADPRRRLRGMAIAHDFRLNPDREHWALGQNLELLPTPQITEAQTWFKSDNGHIVLVASNTPTLQLLNTPTTCHI